MARPDALPAALDTIVQHGGFVVATADQARNLYAQFSSHGEDLLAEVVSNTYLAKADRLSAEQEAELRDRGWRLDTGGNWQRKYELAESSDAQHRAALDALSALAEIYGVTGDLHIEAEVDRVDPSTLANPEDPSAHLTYSGGVGVGAGSLLLAVLVLSVLAAGLALLL